MNQQAQTLAVKRAQVEFHNFASFGEPERVKKFYQEENVRRGAVLRNHLEFIGQMTPFLEIGANAGHTSYMLANEFGADGFATDLSADSLRHGIVLMDEWNMEKAPVRLAADALHLPVPDNSLRCVLACQMLSQFMDIEAVFIEAKRVLAPGGHFIFLEEPLRRILNLGLYRAPYWDSMKPWERLLHKWGLLGFIARDVIGAAQEENFGIRQNHRMELRDWHQLIDKHFPEHELEIFVAERGWGETIVRKLARRIDKHGSDWVGARLLGGTIAAICRKPGHAEVVPELPFERRLRCPDCMGALRLDEEQTLCCTACAYKAPNEGGVYNVLRSADKKELYPGDRADVIDFTQGSQESKLGAGWYDLEGVFGNKYRWIQGAAEATLKNVRGGAQKLRIRGHAHEKLFSQNASPKVTISVNGEAAGLLRLERVGLFIFEADIPEAAEYKIRIEAEPIWQNPPDERWFSLNLSMLRLDPRG